jgi:hypothetical protein
MGIGPREIRRDTGVHRTIIRSLWEIAKVEGWLEPEADLPSEEDIRRLRKGQQSNRGKRARQLREKRSALALQLALG